MANIDQQIPWVEAFIEIAMRAIRRVHHDHILWSLSQNPNVKTGVSLLNQGQGIELAEENHVCAAISQEFIASRFTKNFIVEDDVGKKAKGQKKSNQFRYYVLHREIKEGNKKIDFVSQRLYPGLKVSPYKKTFIEAKRVRIYSSKADGEKPTPGSPQYGGIAKDIKALEIIAKKYRGKKITVPRTYILLWSIVNKASKKDSTPEKFLENLNKSKSKHCKNLPKLHLRETRWLPLSWTDPEAASESADDAKSANRVAPLENIRVSKALWISLIEFGHN